jgi:hypothetical protein
VPQTVGTLDQQYKQYNTAGDDPFCLLWLFRTIAWIQQVLALHSRRSAYIGGPDSDRNCCDRYHDKSRTTLLLQFRTRFRRSTHRRTSWECNRCNLTIPLAILAGIGFAIGRRKSALKTQSTQWRCAYLMGAASRLITAFASASAISQCFVDAFSETTCRFLVLLRHYGTASGYTCVLLRRTC